MTETKRCSKCGKEFPLDQFYNWPNRSPNISAQCKPCTRERVYAKRALNPEFFNKRCAEYYRKNTDKVKAYQLAYRTRPENRQKAIEKSQAWMAIPENKKRHSDWKRQRAYGLPIGEYDRMLAQQGGACAICGTSEPGGRGNSFTVDHCHSKNVVRGLLCHNCNVLIGYAREDISILEKAIQYILLKNK